MIAHAGNVARDLLARLIDEAELEAAPIEAVRADLGLLGADPARAIRFSRRLAEEAASPAAGLLVKSLAAEDSDREITKLESVDLRAIHAELSAASPLAAAYAQRLANAAAGRTRRPSRRFWYGVGGAITAIAASVLIFVAVSPPELVPQQMAYVPPETSSELVRTSERQTAASGSSAPALPPAAPAPATPASADNAPSESISISGYHRQPSATKEEGTAAGSNDAVFGQGGLSLEGPIDQAGATFPRSRSAAANDVGDLRIVAALILQPELVPEPLRQSDLTGGDLPSRLAEAAQFQGRSRIVALVTLEHPDGHRIDEMLMYFPVGNLGLQQSESQSLGGSNASRALNEADLARIDAEPTLRQLLGGEIDQFYLIQMQTPASTGPQ